MRISLILFLGLSVIVTTVQTFRVVGNLTVVAKLNSNATLPCHVEPEMDLTKKFVEWSVNLTLNEKTVHVLKYGQPMSPGDQHEDFRGRTEILTKNLEKGDISVTIYNVTLNDAGNYTCYVQINNETKNKSYVRLIVTPKLKGGGLEAVTTSPPTNSPSPSGPSSAAIGGGIGALVCVVALILFIIFYPRCKSQQHVQVQNGNEMSLRQLHQGQGPANEEQEPLHQGQGPANEEQ